MCHGAQLLNIDGSISYQSCCYLPHNITTTLGVSHLETLHGD